MAQSLQRLQILELSKLFTRKDALEGDLAAIEHLEIQAAYMNMNTGLQEPISSQLAFYTTEHSLVAAVKAHICANIKAELAKVEAEIAAIGDPVAKVEKALPISMPQPTDQRQDEAA